MLGCMANEGIKDVGGIKASDFKIKMTILSSDFKKKKLSWINPGWGRGYCNHKGPYKWK